MALGADLVTCAFTATPITAQPASCTATVVGDPQFVGLLGQSYQVHGVDGAVYNLISDRDVHINSRFAFLSQGECLKDAQNKSLYTCWSHAGSYLQSLALQTAEGDRLLVESGPAASGFSSVMFDSQLLSVGTVELSVGDEVLGQGNLIIRYTSLRSLTIANAGLWTIDLENSDGFLNIVSLSVSSMSSLTQEVHSHGLIGQTWRRDQQGADVQQVEGSH